MSLALMEKIMSKTNETSNIDHNTLDDHRTVTDRELDTVTGGMRAPKVPIN